MPRVHAHPAQTFPVLEQPTDIVQKLLLVTRRRQTAAVAIADMLVGSGGIVGYHRQARSHGLGHHVAEGIGQAGEQEQVRTGIGR